MFFNAFIWVSRVDIFIQLQVVELINHILKKEKTNLHFNNLYCRIAKENELNQKFIIYQVIYIDVRLVTQYFSIVSLK